jgi:hypothetical protein
MSKTDGANKASGFNGTIKLDVRDSTPDWNAFLAKKAPKDAPNVLVILYDDTGCAAWSACGGRIEMPTLDRLAKNGLTYSQWHTTAVCSPTRSCFLTGRNHHQNAFGSIAESAVGFPGYSGHIPDDIAPMAKVLRDAGWSTFWVGKNHNVPVDAFDMAASRKSWPLGLGYDLSTVSSAARQTSGSATDRGQSHRRAALLRGRRLSLLEGTSPTRPSLSFAIQSNRKPTSPGTCGTARAQIMLRIMLHRTISTSTKASSMTATSLIANGCSNA